MRVLVIGATSYIGSRLIPVLLDAGHEVLAGARDPSDLPNLWWYGRVVPVEVDVLDAASAHAAVDDQVDAVVYLVHGMANGDFADADHVAAEHTRNAVTAAGVARVVYVSGIVPDVPEEELSAHLRSRLNVERILSESAATVVTLRAAMIFGGGSTSFELMRQLADRLPITVVPDWMQHRVEPIAIVDIVQAITGALCADIGTGHFDVGGGEPILYPDLVQRYTERCGNERPELTVGLLPEKLVAQVASWLADIPSPTVKALMESLRHDMVAGDQRWRAALVSADYSTISTEDAITRAIVEPAAEVPDADRDPLQRLSSDPEWAR